MYIKCYHDQNKIWMTSFKQPSSSHHNSNRWLFQISSPVTCRTLNLTLIALFKIKYNLSSRNHPLVLILHTWQCITVQPSLKPMLCHYFPRHRSMETNWFIIWHPYGVMHKLNIFEKEVRQHVTVKQLFDHIIQGKMIFFFFGH